MEDKRVNTNTNAKYKHTGDRKKDRFWHKKDGKKSVQSSERKSFSNQKNPPRKKSQNERESESNRKTYFGKKTQGEKKMPIKEEQMTTTTVTETEKNISEKKPEVSRPVEKKIETEPGKAAERKMELEKVKEHSTPVQVPAEEKKAEVMESTSKTEAAVSGEKTREPEEKKERRPSVIELKDKSDLFKQVIDVALACEKLSEDSKKLRSRNKELTDERKKLLDEKATLDESLKESQKNCAEKEIVIQKLQQDVAHRDEVVDIIKADKSESLLEFKNALAAALRMYYVDFCDLKNEPMTEDVGLAFADTLDGIFRVLSKNGIDIQK